MEFAKSNLALAQNIQVSRADRAPKQRSGRQPTSFRRPGYRDLFVGCCRHDRGPWFCVPALRLVCLFEDDDDAGPFYTELRFGPRRSGGKPDDDEICQARGLTYGSEEEFRVARDLSITHQGADDSSPCLRIKPMSGPI